MTLPLFAQQSFPPPVIDSIQPASGDVTGGTVVTISGDNLSLPPDFACILPCPTTVRFGTSAAIPVIAEFDTYVTVATPPHAAGTVDVTLRTGDGRLVTRSNAFTFISDGEPAYTSVLVPIHLDGTVAGDRGSLWKTEFWIRNDGDTVALLAPWPCPDGGTCPAVFPLTYSLRAGENLKNLPPFLTQTSSIPGRILYVSNDAHDIATSLRVFDSSRATLDAGTELPVIREEEMLTTRADLMSVPVDQNYRLHLRIYDVSQRRAEFRVRMFQQEAGVFPDQSPLQEMTLIASTDEEGPFRIRPAYAEYTGFDTLLHLDIPLHQIRIEVEPLTAGSRFWTFVSITNNETQRLTLVTP